MKRSRSRSVSPLSDAGSRVSLQSITPHRHSKDYDVGVFWDYENVRIPRWCRTADAANAIRSAVIGFGRISERRLYYDSKKASERNTDRVNLDLSGFTLVDCPSRGKKETLDKRMIVDILGFAWERAARRIPTCVVLITSDGDYSYTVAKLRDIGICTVIIHGERTTTADVLLDACDHAMSWIFDVLRRPVDVTLDQDEDDDQDSVSSAEVNALMGTGTSSLDAIDSMLPVNLNRENHNDHSPMEENNALLMPLSRETSLSQALEGRHLVFLNCVSAIQMMQLSKELSKMSLDNLETDSELDDQNQLMWENCWALDSQVVQLYNTKRGFSEHKAKKHYKALRKSAVNGQFIRIGRQEAATGVIHDVSHEGSVDPSLLPLLKSQQYLQLTAEGRAQLSGYIGATTGLP